jgi:protein SCO1/2
MTTGRIWPLILVATLATAGLGIVPTDAHEALPGIFGQVAFDQRVNQPIPPDVTLRDETGQTVHLGQYFGQKPVILSLIYFRCRTLCPMILDGIVRGLRPVTFDIGKEFTILTVSFDPRDGVPEAAAEKAKYVKQYGRPGAAAGWHFLTGDEAQIQRLTEAVGFRYAYDAKTDQFAHAAGIVIATPQGKIARYFYGIDYSPRDLRLGLIEASANKIGTPIDQVLLYCYHYDPLTGTYGLVVMNAIRLAGLVTILILGTFVFIMLRRERRPDPRAQEAR